MEKICPSPVSEVLDPLVYVADTVEYETLHYIPMQNTTKHNAAKK